MKFVILSLKIGIINFKVESIIILIPPGKYQLKIGKPKILFKSSCKNKHAFSLFPVADKYPVLIFQCLQSLADHVISIKFVGIIPIADKNFILTDQVISIKFVEIIPVADKYPVLIFQYLQNVADHVISIKFVGIIPIADKNFILTDQVISIKFVGILPVIDKYPVLIFSVYKM